MFVSINFGSPVVVDTHALDTSIGQITAHLDEEQHPCFGIGKCFQHLGLLPDIALDTSHVFFDPLYSLDAVFLAEKPRIHWSIWEKDEDKC